MISKDDWIIFSDGMKGRVLNTTAYNVTVKCTNGTVVDLRYDDATTMLSRWVGDPRDGDWVPYATKTQ